MPEHAPLRGRIRPRRARPSSARGARRGPTAVPARAIDDADAVLTRFKRQPPPAEPEPAPAPETETETGAGARAVSGVRAEWFTAGAGFPDTKSHKEGIRWLKRSALQAQGQLARALSLEERERRHESERKALERRHEKAVRGLQARLSSTARDAEQREAATSEAQSEVESLRYSIQLLRKKLQRVTEREMQNHMRLRVFAHLEPIFETLQHQFNFRSPEEVMQHIERLEALHTTAMRKQAEAEDARIQAEHQVAALRRQLEDERLKHAEQAFREAGKVDRQLHLLRTQLEDAQRFNQGVAAYKDRYLRLNQGVWALWNKVESEKGMVDAADERQMPSFDEPEQILDALYDLLQRTRPSKAAKRLQALTALANEHWRTVIGQPVAMRFKPKRIFEEVAQAALERADKLERAQVALVEERAAHKQLRESHARLEREKRMLEAERERWRTAVLAATSGGLPSSARGRSRSRSPVRSPVRSPAAGAGAAGTPGSGRRPRPGSAGSNPAATTPGSARRPRPGSAGSARSGSSGTPSRPGSARRARPGSARPRRPE